MNAGSLTRRRRLACGLVAGAIAGVLVGCTSTGGKATPPPSSSTPPPASSSTPSSTPPTPTPSAPPTTQPPSVLAFGGAFTYTDGLKVQVTRPVVFSPSVSAAGTTPGDTAVKLNIVIVNGTGKTFDTSTVIVHAKVGAQGSEAESIFDTGIDGTFTGSIVPGSRDTAVFAYDVPKRSTGKIDVEVQPGFNYDSAHWVGTVS